MKSGIKAVIFDLDGVLLNSMPAHVAAWGETFQEAGLKVSEAFIYQNEGALDWELLKDQLPDSPDAISKETFQGLIERQREIYCHKHGQGVQTFPEARALVEGLRQGPLRLAVVTSSARKVLFPSLLSWMDTHFQVVVTGEAVQRCKPHPEPYRTSLKALDLRPEQALVIENAPAGIRSARGAGIFCVALATTLPPEALAEADHICADHQELVYWLQRSRLF